MGKRLSFQTLTHDQGFSLLETLIALAILSLASLALFQSTATLLQVSDKATQLGERVIERSVARQSFTRFVGELRPSQKDQEGLAFSGSASGFTGMSAFVPDGLDVQMGAISMRLDPNETGHMNLVLDIGEGPIILESFQSQNLSFSYLGRDNIWYKAWPPTEIPDPGFFSDQEFMVPPQLPQAVRLDNQRQEGRAFGLDEETLFWIASINGYDSVEAQRDLADEF